MSAPAALWCDTLLVDDAVEGSVRLTVDGAGRISAVQPRTAARPGDLLLGTVLPGMGNAHSHAFHRALRGRTHADGGDFWRWRDTMYGVAAALDPDRYFALARAVFAEMLVSGWTAVGEFHYLHHRPDGSPWPTEHAMELAIVAAAREVGIRLVLLDSAYLAGGIGAPLAPEQASFGDGSAAGWLRRWEALRDRMGTDDLVTLGAAIHSLRAVPPDAVAEILRELPADLPLHIHVSEQPAENTSALAAWGRSPVRVLADLGALTARLSLVHATHLTAEDIALVGASGATVVMCPTTEADLGDGIGPARALARSGARIAIGSDQNAVIDPFLELRGLEAGERLASGERGRFAPDELLTAGSAAGYASLGLTGGRLRVGDPCDLVEVAASSVRTVGSHPGQLVMTATASDVERVVVGGVVRAGHGRLVGAAGIDPDPAILVRDALVAVERE